MSQNHLLRVELADRSYEISIAHHASPGKVLELVRGKNVLLVADSNTEKLFGEHYTNLLRRTAQKVTLHSFPAGEGSKHLSTVEGICRAAVQASLDRGGLFAALGGGVCGDMTGLAASLYMRGTAFIQIPTTLLAMVDSSVGGKTGVDLPEGKNLIGSFFQPQYVWIDPENLRSCPPVQLSNGFAELVKTAVILDSALFETLRKHSADLFALKEDSPLAEVIARSCELKAQVVSQDEKEKGMRALLNYGHTFGHALEMLTSYGKYEHGQAVAIGMGMAADLACSMGLIRKEDVEKQDELLEAFHLPLKAENVSVTGEAMLQAMKHDKKSAAGVLRLVLPQKIGQAAVYDRVDPGLILPAIEGRLK